MLKMVFRDGVLLALSGLQNPHQLALRARVSSPTVARYVNEPDAVVAMDGFVIAALLTDGLGKSKEEILAMKIGDLFELVDTDRDGE